MGHLLTLFQKIKVILRDGFNRADNALTMGNANTGQAWSSDSGTWGILSNKSYCVSDTDGNTTTSEALSTSDYSVSCTITGQTVTAADRRIIGLCFRGLDSINILRARIMQGAIALQKFDAGVITALASSAFSDVDGVAYTYRVLCQGNNVKVFVDGTLYIDFTLSGGDVKYAAYTKVGFRLTKTATASIPANSDNILVEAL